MRLIETVTFVKQEVRLFSVHFQRIARVFHRLLYVRNAALHRVQFYKISVRRGRDDVGKRRLAAPRRPPENTASQPVQPDRAPQKAPFRDDVRLPDEFVQIVCAHFIGERLCPVFIVVQIKKVHLLPHTYCFQMKTVCILAPPSSSFRSKRSISAYICPTARRAVGKTHSSKSFLIFSAFSLPHRYPAS